MKITATLTLKVVYNSPRTLAKSSPDIRWQLEDIASRAAGEGLMTGDTDLLVDRWETKVDIE